MGIMNKLFKKEDGSLELATRLEQDGRSVELDQSIIEAAMDVILPAPDEYVYGYKGMTKDMKAHGDFQYYLGETFKTYEEIKLCESGFHFSPTLQDAACFYSILGKGNRFFKVKAPKATTVKEDDDRIYYSFMGRKYATNEITILEEVSNEELYELLGYEKKYISFENFVKYRFENKTLDEIKVIQKEENIESFYNNYLKNSFSEVYALSLMDRIKALPIGCFEKMVDDVKHYLITPTSVEMKVYLIETSYLNIVNKTEPNTMKASTKGTIW